MNFEIHTTEERRLVILGSLESAAQYALNALLIKRFCERLGHGVSSDRLEQDLAWLREQGLVMLGAGDGVSVATLTVRGLDVVTGRAKVPGVAQPQPRV